jgi:hypothetical protein
MFEKTLYFKGGGLLDIKNSISDFSATVKATLSVSKDLISTNVFSVSYLSLTSEL